jgi:ABC-2 type transport system permease protein
MKTLIAFIKKECLELSRSMKVLFVSIIFFIFGVMNPAFAKLTPFLMEKMSSSLKEAGIVVKDVKVDAMTSWTQYYKNLGMALLIFVIILSSILTKEYAKKTLVQVLGKGFKRYKVIISKTLVITAFWTYAYLIMYLVTYVYNDFYWNNDIVKNLHFSAFIYWLFGIWIMSMIILFSTISKGNIQVLVLIGILLFAINILQMFFEVDKLSPLKLMDGLNILNGETKVSDYYLSIIIAILLSSLNIASAIFVFNKREISD